MRLSAFTLILTLLATGCVDEFMHVNGRIIFEDGTPITDISPNNYDVSVSLIEIAAGGQERLVYWYDNGTQRHDVKLSYLGEFEEVVLLGEQAIKRVRDGDGLVEALVFYSQVPPTVLQYACGLYADRVCDTIDCIETTQTKCAEARPLLFGYGAGRSNDGESVEDIDVIMRVETDPENDPRALALGDI